MNNEVDLLPEPLRSRFASPEVIGRGAMGIVLKALDRRLGRQVAVKILRRAAVADQDRARFCREARLLAAVSHPHVVRVFDADVAGASPYIVMELLEGQSLAERLRAGPLDEASVLKVLGEILDGLTHVHDQSILHRDVKPSNVFLSVDGRAVLTDFGIARALEPSEEITRRGELVGTPRFMAPEILLGRASSRQSDLFSVGLIGLEALTGEDIFARSAGPVTLHSVVSDLTSGTFFEAASAVLRRRGRTGPVLLRALMPEPAERFPSAAEMRAALSAQGPARRAPSTRTILMQAGARADGATQPLEARARGADPARMRRIVPPVCLAIAVVAVLLAGLPDGAAHRRELASAAAPSVPQDPRKPARYFEILFALPEHPSASPGVPEPACRIAIEGTRAATAARVAVRLRPRANSIDFVRCLINRAHEIAVPVSHANTWEEWNEQAVPVSWFVDGPNDLAPIGLDERTVQLTASEIAGIRVLLTP